MNIRQGTSKYKVVIIGTSILLTCIVATMIANVYIANKINNTSFLISKTNDQKTMIQRISKALLRVRTQKNGQRNFQLDLAELAYSYEQFNNTLYGLSQSGTLINNATSKIKIDKVTDKQGVKILSKAILLWTDIKLAMTPLDDPKTPISDDKLRAISDIVNAYSVQMMGVMDELVIFFQQQNDKNRQHLYMSYLGSAFFTIALIFFLLFKTRVPSSVATEESYIPEQMEMSIDIPSTEQITLTQFFSDTEADLQLINSSLEQLSTDGNSIRQFSALIEPINNIRENAATIGCLSIEKIATNLLSEAELLQHDEAQLTDNNFDSINSKLEQLNKNYHLFSSLLNEENTIQNEITEIEPKEENNSSPSQYDDWLQLKELAIDIAQQQDKKVELHLHGLQTELPEEYHTGLINISEQLILNSVIHGIESAEIRQSALKPEFGQITITLKPTAEHGYEFIYEDDGQGINYQEIRKAVVAQGFATQATANELDKNQLAVYIFKLGFSTLKDTSVDSGGGLGMDIVKHTIDKLGGKTIVLSVVNKNIRFTVALPPVYEADEENSYLNTA